jgi:hypothetical protein
MPATTLLCGQVDTEKLHTHRAGRSRLRVLLGGQAGDWAVATTGGPGDLQVWTMFIPHRLADMRRARAAADGLDTPRG